jgi:hypothetical protein
MDSDLVGSVSNGSPQVEVPTGVLTVIPCGRMPCRDAGSTATRTNGGEGNEDDMAEIHGRAD